MEQCHAKWLGNKKNSVTGRSNIGSKNSVTELNWREPATPTGLGPRIKKYQIVVKCYLIEAKQKN
jgi:hypothetical protein